MWKLLIYFGWWNSDRFLVQYMVREEDLEREREMRYWHFRRRAVGLLNPKLTDSETDLLLPCLFLVKIAPTHTPPHWRRRREITSCGFRRLLKPWVSFSSNSIFFLKNKKLFFSISLLKLTYSIIYKLKLGGCNEKYQKRRFDVFVCVLTLSPFPLHTSYNTHNPIPISLFLFIVYFWDSCSARW